MSPANFSSTLVQRSRPYITRRAIARLLSTFLCCIAIVIPPFSILGGPAAFLVLGLKELVFSVQANLSQHLEATILNIMGALVTIGVSTFAKLLATLPPNDSVNSRAIPAMFLVSISFFAGWVKSRLPRLQMSMRISCFVSIWLLTVNIGDPDKVREDSKNFLWITLVPSTISLLVSLLVLRWTSTTFGEQVVECFALLHKRLSASLHTVLNDVPSDLPSDPADSNRCQKLLMKSIALNAAYSQAAFELRIGRLKVKTIKPFIGIVEHLRRELAWGLNPSRSLLSQHNNENTPQPLRQPARELSNALLVSMTIVQRVVTMTFQNGVYSHDFSSEKDAISRAKIAISTARDAVRDELAKVFNPRDSETTLQRDGASELCLAVISLLQMAHELQQALQVAIRIIALYESSSSRLWYPKLSLAWLGLPPKAVLLDDQQDISTLTEREPEGFLSSEEVREGLAERHALLPRSARGRHRMYQDFQDGSTGFSLSNVPRFFRRLWSHPSTLRVRLSVSKVLRSVQHSRHIRHGFKNAAGVALLSFPAFLPRNSTGCRTFAFVRQQWMVITYVWVLEVNTGASFRTAYLRLSGTIVGALYAYITWLICGVNPYGLVIMTTLVDIPVSYLIINTNIPSMGTVINVTVAPIAFTAYITPNMDISIIWLAVARGLMISGGVLAALLMNSIFFPQHCRVLFLANTGRTLALLSRLYLTMCRDMFRNGGDHPFDPNDKGKALRLELQARGSLDHLSMLIVAMNDEISLIPKPMEKYRRTVVLLQRLLDVLTGLRKVRENIPREEAIIQVLNERRELISSVCITLFACENAFRVRQSIPQFLPSARQALGILEQKIANSLRQAQKDMPEDFRLMGLSPVYAFVEGEIMKAMVDALEDTVELCRSLFGSSDWLSVDRRQGQVSDSSLYEVESGDGWYTKFDS